MSSPHNSEAFESFGESLPELRSRQLLLDTINIGNDQLLWDVRQRLIQTVSFTQAALDQIPIDCPAKQFARYGNEDLVRPQTLIRMRHVKHLEGVQIKRGTL